MDPYWTLGVSKECTHDEVKDAYRAKARATHPDRGGDELAFIRLHAAYEEILAELERRPLPRVLPQRAAGPPSDNGHAGPVDPTGDLHRGRSEASAHDQHTSNSPELFATRHSYVAWLRHVSTEAASRDPRRRWKWLRFSGVAFLLFAIFSVPAALFCGFVSTMPDVVKATERDPHASDILAGLFGAVFLATLFLAVGIAWRNRNA
jgi:hypothetical protein